MNNLTSFIADAFIKRLPKAALQSKYHGKVRPDYINGYLRMSG